MAVELVQRASELQLTEREQAAGWSRKAAMAGSSFRKLQDAMLIVAFGSDGFIRLLHAKVLRCHMHFEQTLHSMPELNDGSDRSYSEPSSDSYRRASSPAGDDADEEAAVVNSRPQRRRARAGAGARLKDLLQQEAKDLRTLEAEADKETEELAVAAKAKRRCNNREAARRQQKQQRKSQPVDANAGLLGESAQQLARALLDQTEQQAGQNDTDDAVVTQPKASCSSGLPRFTIPAAFRGPDCGPGAAAGGALGGFDSCWSAPKEPSSKQQRSAKRKRDSSGCVEAGTAHLNKRRQGSWEDDLDQPQEVEFMLGCSKCSCQRSGCGVCRLKPQIHRPMARWQPDGGQPQIDVPEAPTFKPTPEEFADPYEYVMSVYQEAGKYGIVKVVPPKGWAPPFALQKGTNGTNADSFRFAASRQFTSHLCMRQGAAGAAAASCGAGAASNSRNGRGPRRGQGDPDQLQLQLLGADATLLAQLDERAAEGTAALIAASSAAGGIENQSCHQDQPSSSSAGPAAGGGRRSRTITARSRASTQEDDAGVPGAMHTAAAAANAVGQNGNTRSNSRQRGSRQQSLVKVEPEQLEEHQHPKADAETQHQHQQSGDAVVKQEQKLPVAASTSVDSEVSFTLAQTHTLRSFAAAADWAKRVHFSAQPCNADFIAMLQPPAAGKQLRASASKRQKGDAQQQQQRKPSNKDSAGAAGADDDTHSSDTAASDSEDSRPATTAAAAAVPARHSSRLQQKTTQQKGSRGKAAAAFTDGTEDAADGRPKAAKSTTVAVAQARTSAGAAAAAGGGGVSASSLSGQKRSLHATSSAGAPFGAANSVGQPQVSIAQIEAEFWRIVQQPDPGRIVETLYGQELDSGRHGSGFPLPAWRGLPSDVRSGRHMSRQEKDPGVAKYAAAAWNLNNLPHNRANLLQHLPAADPIPGLTVPWLYVGSCLSAACWQVEEHALYHVNYLHIGAPKVWYGVPEYAAEALEVALQDCLPHLWAADRQLMHKQVTAVSPNELRARGVPVYRLVQEAGSFVVALPNAYHAAINTGFNVAEAVAVGPWDWLPAGAEAVRKYRQQGRPVAFSYDQLLLTLVSAAKHVALAHGLGGDSSSVEAGAVSCEEEAAGLVSRPRAPRLLDPGMTWAERWSAGVREQSVPKPAVMSAAGELVLRIEEEQQRQQVARQFGVNREQRMFGVAGQRDAVGMLTDTAQTDCEVCKADLWLYSVVSSSAPGRAVCPEHAAALGAAPGSCTLLFRHSLEELQRLVFEAVTLFPGAAESIRSMQQHVRQRPWMKVKSLGPLMEEAAANSGPPLAPELRPGGREPGTPVAGWVKQLLLLAKAREALVGHGVSAHLPRRQRKSLIVEAVSVAAAAMDSIRESGELDQQMDLGRPVPQPKLSRHEHEAVQLVLQELLAQHDSSGGRGSRRKGWKPVKQRQQPSLADGGDQGPLQPRQRKLPAWLQEDLLMDNPTAKRKPFALHPSSLPVSEQEQQHLVAPAVRSPPSAAKPGRSGRTVAGSSGVSGRAEGARAGAGHVGMSGTVSLEGCMQAEDVISSPVDTDPQQAAVASVNGAVVPAGSGGALPLSREVDESAQALDAVVMMTARQSASPPAGAVAAEPAGLVPSAAQQQEPVEDVMAAVVSGMSHSVAGPTRQTAELKAYVLAERHKQLVAPTTIEMAGWLSGSMHPLAQPL
eukprot:gene11303-11453_t